MTNAAIKDPPKKLKSPDMKLKEHVTFDWRAEVDHGVTIDDLLDPVFWSDVSGHCFQGKFNRVEITWKDGSQWAELLVVGYGPTWAKMVKLNYVVLNTPEGIKTVGGKDYEIKWSGPHSKFRIIRLADGEVIRDGFENKELAEVDLKEYVASLKG